MRHDRCITLTDPRGFNQDQIKASDPARSNRIRQGRANFTACIAGCQRAHKDVGMVYRIHANSIAQQRTARFSPGWIDREHSDS